MAELDAELLERVARWCAEAGRQAATAQIRRALAPLSWDEILAVRALLADPPPARPLGPFALADLARGAPADVAAERERAGRYSSEEGERTDAAEPPPPDAGAPPPRPAARRRVKGRPADPIIRRARDAAPVPPPAPPARPLLEELLLPEGRGVLERLVRRAGPSRAAVLAALDGWGRPDGGAPTEDDLVRLLGHHGMTRSFERRERDGLLHAFRSAGGVRTVAAARLGVDPAGLDAAVARLGARTEVERIRDQHRAELRHRATLSGRLRLVLEAEERLRDLELLDEVEADLRSRLPEHLRALGAAGGPLAAALERSLTLTPDEVRTVAARFGLDLAGPPRGPAPRPVAGPTAARGPRRRDAAKPGGRPDRRGGRTAPRPQGAGARGGLSGGPRASSSGGERPAFSRGPRSGSPRGPRTGFSGGPRPGSPAGLRTGFSGGPRKGFSGGPSTGSPGGRPMGQRPGAGSKTGTRRGGDRPTRAQPGAGPSRTGAPRGRGASRGRPPPGRPPRR